MTLKVVAVLFAKVRLEMVTSVAERSTGNTGLKCVALENTLIATLMSIRYCCVNDMVQTHG